MLPPPADSASSASRLCARTTIYGLPPSPPTPISIQSAVALSGPAIPTVLSPIGTLAFSQWGLKFAVEGAPTNAALFASPAADGTPNFSVRVQETYPTGFRQRSGAVYAGPDVSPVPTPQDVPGTVTYHETDFYNPLFPSLPGRGDLAHAGLANQGTRLTVHFTSVPVA